MIYPCNNKDLDSMLTHHPRAGDLNHTPAGTGRPKCYRIGLVLQRKAGKMCAANRDWHPSDEGLFRF